MALFFLHIRDGAEVIHAKGSDLPDLAAARTEAIQSARELSQGVLDEGRLGIDRLVEIADESGRSAQRFARCKS